MRYTNLLYYVAVIFRRANVSQLQLAIYLNACHYLPLPFLRGYRLEKGHNILLLSSHSLKRKNLCGLTLLTTASVTWWGALLTPGVQS